MKIAIIGYGKMGKEVEKHALSKGHSIAGIVNKEDDQWPEADVAIEFSSPESAIKNFKKAFDLNLPIVTGTTGWYEKMNDVKSLVESNAHGFLYASNFSIGVNLFFKLNHELAKIMDGHKDYLCSVEEIHHTEKKDAPSGTAITLADGILRNSNTLNKWVGYENDAKPNIDPNALAIRSLREPKVPGTHIIQYQNEIDSIEIKHVAKNRAGFALGAIFAAEWLVGRTGFYTMTDALDSN